MEAKAELERRSATLDAYSFCPQSSSEVVHEDGSIFKVSDSFLEEWTDSMGCVWIFQYCEHYPAMFYDREDLLYWSDFTRNYEGRCIHMKTTPGPRAALRHGSAETLVCDDCGFYRTMHHRPGRWQPGPVKTEDSEDL
jgi:hypothetical protein